MNASREGYHVEYEQDHPFIRVPLSAVKSLTETMLRRHATERQRGPFASLADFVQRVSPSPDEMLNLIRAGAFDAFGDSRPMQFWQARRLGLWPQGEAWLFPATGDVPGLPATLEAPDYLTRLEAEMKLLGFTVSGDPLNLHPGIAWESYCPIARLAEFLGQRVTVCGLIIEERLHQQSTAEQLGTLKALSSTIRNARNDLNHAGFNDTPAPASALVKRAQEVAEKLRQLTI